MLQTIQLLEMTVFQGKDEQELKSKKYCAEMTMIGRRAITAHRKAPERILIGAITVKQCIILKVNTMYNSRFRERRLDYKC